MVTNIDMWRTKLITKEEWQEKYYGRNIKGDTARVSIKGDTNRNYSVNDDLESFFEDLRLRIEPNETVEFNFLPRLTEEEMELVERKDTSYLASFIFNNPDVIEADMKLSESDSKFVEGRGWRKTFTIEN